MLSRNDPGYLDTKAVKQGQKKLESPLRELSHWISDRYGIRPINIFCDRLDPPPRKDSFLTRFFRIFLEEPKPETSTTRINIIFETAVEAERFKKQEHHHIDPKKEAEEKMRELARHIPLEKQKDFQDLLVLFSDFRTPYLSDIRGSLPKGAILDFLKKPHSPPIWEIHETDSLGILICVFEENQIESFRHDPRVDELRRTYFDLIKPVDFLRIYTLEDVQISFFSKERLDRDYQGDWFLYYR